MKPTRAGPKTQVEHFLGPNITAVGFRNYVYLQKRLEIVTFEIKPAEAVSIMGILEAIAHRAKAAHRAYVMYATSRVDFENAIDGERITELAQKYGVGIVLTEKPDAVGQRAGRSCSTQSGTSLTGSP